jgi:hypothetical protein
MGKKVEVTKKSLDDVASGIHQMTLAHKETTGAIRELTTVVRESNTKMDHMGKRMDVIGESMNRLGEKVDANTQMLDVQNRRITDMEEAVEDTPLLMRQELRRSTRPMYERPYHSTSAGGGVAAGGSTVGGGAPTRRAGRASGMSSPYQGFYRGQGGSEMDMGSDGMEQETQEQEERRRRRNRAGKQREE